MFIEIEAAEYHPKHLHADWNIVESTYDAVNITYKDFFEKHLIKNIPCIIKDITATWECSEKWIKDDHINYEYMIQTYGDIEASVAECSEILDYAQRTLKMTVRDYMNYMQQNQKDKLLYLKDMHLKKLRPNDNFYEVPQIFLSDWLNEYALDKNEDDFKFVYIGPKKSWTPLHVDVYCSYSWSVNVIGRKKWILFPPGEEEKLKNEQNHLELLFDAEKNNNVKHYVIFQEQGDAIFVPSGWHHQVENLLDTISINHNWNNGCNIRFMWELLNKTLVDVENEIQEFKASPEYPIECQNLLKALCGANYESFINMLTHIARKRLNQVLGQAGPHNSSTNLFQLGFNHAKFDLKMLLTVIDSLLEHPNHKNGKIILSDNIMLIKQEIMEVIL